MPTGTNVPWGLRSRRRRYLEAVLRGGRQELLDLRRTERWRVGDVVARHADLLEEPLESRRGDERQKPAGLLSHALERAKGALWRVDEGAGARFDPMVPVQEPELALQHVPRLVFLVVDMRRRTALRQYRRVEEGIGSVGVLAATGWDADDGTVEAVEDPKKAFVLGVLWHPEEDEKSQLI